MFRPTLQLSRPKTIRCSSRSEASESRFRVLEEFTQVGGKSVEPLIDSRSADQVLLWTVVGENGFVRRTGGSFPLPSIVLFAQTETNLGALFCGPSDKKHQRAIVFKRR